MSNLQIFSVFSGTYYEVPEEDFRLLNEGQIPLSKKPGRCNKCYNRGYNGKNAHNLTYNICSCLKKVILFDIIKSAPIDKV